VNIAAPAIGLTSEEAQRRLAANGANAVQDVVQTPINRALRKFWAPVPWMLEAAVVLQLVLREYVEASAVAALLIFNAGLGFFREGRAQATLDALKSRLAVTASARRDGGWKTLSVTDLVQGDVVKLSLGAVVPADVKLSGGSVLVDQSMLTGESVPIEAGPGVETFAGALIRRGEAVGEVVATSARTKFGRSAELIRTTHVESTEQKAIFRVVRNLALFNTKQCLGVGPTCLGARLASASREQFRACSLDKANGLTADGVMLQRQAWASPSL